MKTLAELSFEYIWLLFFGDEEVIDSRYASKQQELLAECLSEISDDEKKALSDVAAKAKTHLLAEPDKHGYTLRDVVTEEEILLLESLESGEFFESFH